MPFPVFEWVFMHRASNERKENIGNINETKPKQEDCLILK